MQVLEGKDSTELKRALLDRIFTHETFAAVKSEDALRQGIARLDAAFLEKYLGAGAETSELQIFCTPTGQCSFIGCTRH